MHGVSSDIGVVSGSFFGVWAISLGSEAHLGVLMFQIFDLYTEFLFPLSITSPESGVTSWSIHLLFSMGHGSHVADPCGTTWVHPCGGG